MYGDSEVETIDISWIARMRQGNEIARLALRGILSRSVPMGNDFGDSVIAKLAENALLMMEALAQGRGLATAAGKESDTM